MTFAEQMAADFAARTAQPAQPSPLDGDTCELCGKPVKSTEPLTRRHANVATYDPETGVSRYLWEHQSCRQEVQLAAMRAADRAAVASRHHDPVVADLMARVEALEAKHAGKRG